MHRPDDGAEKEPFHISPPSEVAPAAKRTSKKKGPTPEEVRRQPSFKLPIEGGKKGRGGAQEQHRPGRQVADDVRARRQDESRERFRRRLSSVC
jgi:hypothetical protein